ncbi:hypothetical protein NY2A_B187R [Paramecium bursaria Chlorella virus NY2A]|uniref:Uncharacterized protein B187R n=1 Tax=Paramecium bursaria Chlorella virus NY2A TaxID=46021 RepID=A7IW62_PBCVN|nr:hypothetical protein NY2A_B187R [Paramecium bursaria Chlorella virus NY2A]ABT14586.1 hypothetical protein NY2A_B187R [Paramecium bursaria Chlorella virus NY2A]
MAAKRIVKKKVTFSNATGKPLASVKYINKEGKSVKLTPMTRKQTPAKLDTIHLKKMRAEAIARKRVNDAKDHVDMVKKAEKNIEKLHANVTKKMKKTTKPAELAHLKAQSNRLNTMKKSINAKKNNVMISFDIAKNKLRAQQRHG